VKENAKAVKENAKTGKENAKTVKLVSHFLKKGETFFLLVRA